MRIAIVGFPLSGKSTLFSAITGLPADPQALSEERLAAVKVPEPRLALLEQLYQPRKTTYATLDFVDLPGSAEGESEHAGLTRHLPTLRKADGLLLVARAFESDVVPPHGGRIDPAADLRALYEEMLLADLVICDNRIERIETTLRKPVPQRDQLRHELELLMRCKEALESEQPLSSITRDAQEARLLGSFGFLTRKPIVAAVNISETQLDDPPAIEDDRPAAILHVCAKLEAELMQLDEADRGEFLASYGIAQPARERIIRACFAALDLIQFFTAGPTEVRAWPIRRGTTAVEAAGRIHSDLARGFIRAETIAWQDLHDAGSLREAKARGLFRQEPKSYVVQDGDILTIKFNV